MHSNEIGHACHPVWSCITYLVALCSHETHIWKRGGLQGCPKPQAASIRVGPAGQNRLFSSLKCLLSLQDSECHLECELQSAESEGDSWALSVLARKEWHWLSMTAKKLGRGRDPCLSSLCHSWLYGSGWVVGQWYQQDELIMGSQHSCIMGLQGSFSSVYFPRNPTLINQLWP